MEDPRILRASGAKLDPKTSFAFEMTGLSIGLGDSQCTVIFIHALFPSLRLSTDAVHAGSQHGMNPKIFSQ